MVKIITVYIACVLSCRRSYQVTSMVPVTRSQTCFCAVPTPTGKPNTSVVMTTDDNTEAKSGSISKCVYTKFWYECARMDILTLTNTNTHIQTYTHFYFLSPNRCSWSFFIKCKWFNDGEYTYAHVCIIYTGSMSYTVSAYLYLSTFILVYFSPIHPAMLNLELGKSWEESSYYCLLLL